MQVRSPSLRIISSRRQSQCFAGTLIKCILSFSVTKSQRYLSIMESASVMHYTCETRVVWRRRAVIVGHRVWLRRKRERKEREVLNDVDLYPLSTLPRSARALLHQYPALLPFSTINVPTPCFRPAVLKIRLCESRRWLVQLAVSRQYLPLLLWVAKRIGSSSAGPAHCRTTTTVYVQRHLYPEFVFQTELVSMYRTWYDRH